MATHWDTPDPYALLPLRTTAQWRALEARYPGARRARSMPFRRSLEVARANGAECVVIETRYIDRDYRSEYSGFYSRTHADVPNSAHRLHFFAKALKPADVAALPADPGYIGFVVVRPIPGARVGRTMLPPPPGIRPYVRSVVSDRVHLFGQPLDVPPSVPFMQQDTQLGRCAHVAGWICHHVAHLRGEVGRRTLADLTMVAGQRYRGPSPGLTVDELSHVLTDNELAPTHYPLQEMPAPKLVPWESAQLVEYDDRGYRLHDGLWNRELIRTACRYLNGGRPVIVATSDHTFVLVGYKRMLNKDGTTYISFIRHDDQAGPYLLVQDPFNDVDIATGRDYGLWEDLLVPLPDKLWLPPEPVEALAGRELRAFAARLTGQFPAAADVERAIKAGDLALRLYAISSNQLKRESEARLDPTYARELRLQRMPRYVWVAELVDRAIRDGRAAGHPNCVLGEGIYDATSSEMEPIAIVQHVPGVAVLARLSPKLLPCRPDLYQSGGIGPA